MCTNLETRSYNFKRRVLHALRDGHEISDELSAALTKWLEPYEAKMSVAERWSFRTGFPFTDTVVPYKT